MPTKTLQTTLVHPEYVSPMGFSALPPAIHHASTVLFESVAALREHVHDWSDKSSYTYGLKGTPTTYELEARLAEIEGGTLCLLTPSGLAAITLVDMTCLATGDDVLLPDNVYGPSRELGGWLQARLGVSARFYDPLIGSGLAGMIRPNTRLVWVEAPGSVSMEVPDVPALTRAAHEHGALVGMDNTWSAGLAFRPFDHGVDISIQALTKYQSGGSDVLMGAVITRDAELARRLGAVHHLLGYGVGKDDAYLVLRSLPSLKLRFEAHDRGARQVATWLQERSEVVRLLHPAFPDCPGHETWKRDFTGAGGVFSVLVDPRFTEAQIDAFIDGLELFKIGYSWGGAASLCLPYRMADMRDRWEAEGTLVRFHIGLEDPQDLIEDLRRSLAMNLG